MNPKETSGGSVIAKHLRTNKWAQTAELLVIFFIPGITLGILQLLNDPSPFMMQALLCASRPVTLTA